MNVRSLLFLVVSISTLMVLMLLLCLRESIYSPFSRNLEIEFAHRHGSSLLGSNGVQIASYGYRNYKWLPLEELPESLKNAFLAAEDHAFYEHSGISWRGIVRAALVNVKFGSLRQGASTITQQLVRHLFLNREKSILRKIKEIILALRLEQKYTKSEILEAYLNTIFLGYHSYGVRAASKNYFDKEPHELTLSESALLAGLPIAPSRLALHHNMKGAMERRNLVLNRMASEGLISDRILDKEILDIPNLIVKSSQKKAGHSDFYAQSVAANIYRYTSIQNLSSSSVVVETGFDQVLNKRLSEIIMHVFSDLIKRADVELAYIAIDPRTGIVRSQVGSKSFLHSQFDRTYSLSRKANKMLLPFLYRFVLDSGLDLDTVLPHTAEISLIELVDLPASQQLEILVTSFGIGTLIDYLKDFGFKVSSIGTVIHSQVSPLDLARAYGALALSGRVCPARYIQRLIGSDEEESYPVKMCNELGGAASSYLTSYLLERSDRGLSSKGVGLQPFYYFLDKEVKNTWFVSFNAEIVISLWIGSELGVEKLDFGRYSLESRISDLNRHFQRLKQFSGGKFILPPSDVDFKLRSSSNDFLSLPVHRNSFKMSL